MLTKKIAVLSFIIFFFNYSFSQYRSDFQISDSGLTPYFDIDNNNRIHIVWEKCLEDDHGTYYLVLDSIGNTVFSERRISGTLATRTPKLAINKDLIACIWEDRVHLKIWIFNTYIKVKILKEGQDYSEEFHVDDGAGDAVRGRPTIIWPDDSTLFAVWCGQGSRTDWGISDIYMAKLLLPLPLHRAFEIDTVINNSQIKVDEFCPTVIKKYTDNGYLTIWLEKDTSSVWNIAGVTCDDSLRPVSDKIVFASFDSLPSDYISKPFVIHKKNGNILIVWEKDTSKSYANIYFQEFTEQGAPVGYINKVNEEFACAATEVTAAIDTDGNLIIVWENGNKNLFAQRYSPEMVEIGMNFRLNVLATGINSFPCVRLKNRKIYTAWEKYYNGSNSIWMNILDFDNPTIIEKECRQIPQKYALYQNYPNPFNPKTTIAFDLPEEAKVEIIIYDLMGREVWRTNKTNYTAGTHSIVWNGTNHAGQPVGTGIYLIRLNSRKYSAAQKVLLMK